MIFQLLSFGAGFLTVVIYVVIFLILMRLLHNPGWFRLQVLVGGLVHLISTMCFLYIIPDFQYWYSLGAFSVVWFAFFTFSTAIYVSISARILRTLAEAPDACMNMEDIFTVCVQKPFSERALFFVTTGMVKITEGKYRITEKGHHAALRVLALRKLFGMQSSGLYRQ